MYFRLCILILNVVIDVLYFFYCHLFIMCLCIVICVFSVTYFDFGYCHLFCFFIAICVFFLYLLYFCVLNFVYYQLCITFLGITICVC